MNLRDGARIYEPISKPEECQRLFNVEYNSTITVILVRTAVAIRLFRWNFWYRRQRTEKEI